MLFRRLSSQPLPSPFPSQQLLSSAPAAPWRASSAQGPRWRRRTSRLETQPPQQRRLPWPRAAWPRPRRPGGPRRPRGPGSPRGGRGGALGLMGFAAFAVASAGETEARAETGPGAEGKRCFEREVGLRRKRGGYRKKKKKIIHARREASSMSCLCIFLPQKRSSTHHVFFCFHQ